MGSNLRNILLTVVFATLLCGCGARVTPKSYADYSSSSRFKATDSVRVENLVVLARVWGLAKYHHPAFADSVYNADYELFELLPRVAYVAPEERNRVLWEWVDGLGEFRSDEKRLKRWIEKKRYYSPTDWTWLDDPTLGAKLSAELQALRWAKRSKPSYYATVFQKEHISFDNESTAGPCFSDAGYNLLTLFRLWNMAQYYFPNVDITNKKWADVLPEYVPKFLSTNDIDLTTAEFIAELSDTHSRMDSNHIYTNTKIPVELGFVENKLIVTNNQRVIAPDEESLFMPGDEIISIGGRAPEYFVERARKYISASNENVLRRDAAEIAVMTDNMIASETVVLQRDHSRHELHVPTISAKEYSNRKGMWMEENKRHIELLNDSVGYLYAGKFKNKDGARIMEKFKNTSAIIVDMRCYPSDFMPFTFVGRYFVPHKTQHVIITRQIKKMPGYFEKYPVSLGTRNDDYYKGKVVVLVNEWTQSSAEYQTMAFQAIPGAIIVGSQTAGADGNVVYTPLPRGIYTRFSGIGVYYPDGTNTQRTGIRIDHYVETTIEGIRAGRDEVLERALEIIETGR